MLPLTFGDENQVQEKGIDHPPSRKRKKTTVVRRAEGSGRAFSTMKREDPEERGRGNFS